MILDSFKGLDLQGAVLAGKIPERPNLLYRLQGNGAGPTLLFVAHTDTKPVGDVRDQWKTDPLRGQSRTASSMGWARRT